MPEEIALKGKSNTIRDYGFVDEKTPLMLYTIAVMAEENLCFLESVCRICSHAVKGYGTTKNGAKKRGRRTINPGYQAGPTPACLYVQVASLVSGQMKLNHEIL